MSGDNALITTLLIGAVVIGTGGAALAAAPALLAGAGAATAGAATFAGVTASTFAATAALGSAGMSIMQGYQQKEALEFERAQILERNEREKVQYAIEGAERESRLADILSTQTASFGSRGLMLGTGASLRAEEVSIGEANKESGIAEFNQKGSERQLLTAAEQKKIEGRAAVQSGYINAGKSLLSSAGQGAFGTGGATGGGS